MPAAARGSRAPRHRSSLPIARIAWIGAALLLGAGPARAGIHPAATAVWERAIGSVGGAAACDSEQTLHLKGRIETAGLDGSWELWTAAPDRWVRSLRLGPLRFREGFDGTTAWRTDYSEKSVVVLSEEAVEDQREEGWFLNGGWARNGQGGGFIRLGSRVFSDNATYDVLVVQPPKGKPRRLFVNTKSGLVERTLHEHDQYKLIEDRPGDYRMLAGRKRPTTYTAPTLLPGDQPVQRVRVDSAWANVPIDSSFFAPPRLAGRPLEWKQTRGAVRVPFSYSSQCVMLKVSINGAAPQDFVLDTGASLTVIDRDYAASIGLRAEGEAAVQGISASSDMRFAKVRSIGIPGRKGTGVTLRDFRVALIGMGEGTKMVMWKKPVGYLGADFLSQFVFDLDFDSLKAGFRDPAGFAYAGSGSAIPFELFSGIPVVPMKLDGSCSGKFMVDVGNSFHFVVYGSAVRGCDMIRRKPRKSVEVYGGGVGGGFVSSLCRLDSLRIGPYSWREPVAALSLHSRGGVGSEDLAGNIGCGFLEKFHATFDYAHRTLYLEPGARYGQREKVSRLGAMLARVGGRVYAGNILNGSAAFDAGIKWFDEIIAIDDRPLEHWTREEVDRLLEQGEVGTVHKITYRRMEDDPKTVEVTLRDVL